jgi:prepilin-type N-terminal cleavage/methylation domain-containing protein
MDRFKKDNSGFSLVELIITIAIMSVMLGTVSYGLSLSSGKPAEECARKLASTLSQARTTTMGKYRNVITVKACDSGIVVDEHIVIKMEGDEETSYYDRSSTVGKKSVNVEYKYSGLGDYVNLTEGEITIRFNSGTGALTLPSDEGQLVFRITKAGKEKYVVINCLTGKIAVGNDASAASV